MRRSFPCLASLEAMWAVDGADLAAAVLSTAFSGRIGDAGAEVPLDEVWTSVCVVVLGDERPADPVGIPVEPRAAAVRSLVCEGVLLLEQRLFAARASRGGSGATTLVLLRRGKAALESGDPATAWRNP